MPRSRAFACVGAGLGTFALALQLWLNLQVAASMGISPGQAVWRYFGFFTILTNAWVVLALAAWAEGARGSVTRFLCRPQVQTAATAAIVIVAIIYHVLLRNLWQPHGWLWVADQLLHTVMPAWFVLHWWTAVPKAALGWWQVSSCLIWPAIYAVYALTRGALDGWYPYPFINVTNLGYARVVANACGLFAAFALLAAILVALGRWQSRRSRAATRPA